MSVDRCLFCGAEIPEGRQVCLICEQTVMEQKNDEEKLDKIRIEFRWISRNQGLTKTNNHGKVKQRKSTILKG